MATPSVAPVASHVTLVFRKARTYQSISGNFRVGQCRGTRPRARTWGDRREQVELTAGGAHAVRLPWLVRDDVARLARTLAVAARQQALSAQHGHRDRGRILVWGHALSRRDAKDQQADVGRVEQDRGGGTYRRRCNGIDGGLPRIERDHRPAPPVGDSLARCELCSSVRSTAAEMPAISASSGTFAACAASSRDLAPPQQVSIPKP